MTQLNYILLGGSYEYTQSMFIEEIRKSSHVFLKKKRNNCRLTTRKNKTKKRAVHLKPNLKIKKSVVLLFGSIYMYASLWAENKDRLVLYNL